MARSRISGITVEIGGDTTKLTEALKGVDKSLKDTETQLKDVNKLLKMDPSNVELLRQKQELLGKAVKDTKTRQEELTKALEQAKSAGDTEENRREQDLLQRELIETSQKLEDLQNQYKKTGPTLESISAKTGEMAEKTRGLSTAAGAAAVGMIGMAAKAASTADDLQTMSNVTGFSVEELQKLKYASDFVDVSYETMTGSIQKLTKQMASGNAAFDTLGISVTNADGSMRSANEVWWETVAALGEVTNETERDQISMELFGKSAMEMAGVVDDGGAALKQLGEDAEATGNILSTDAVQDAATFNDKIDELKGKASMAFMEAGATLAETLVPALEKLVEVVTNVLKWFGNLDGTTQTVILTVLGLVAAISPVLGLISTLTGLAAALNVAMLPMIGTIALIVAGIAALVAAGVWLYKNWDTVKEKTVELWTKLRETWEGIKTAISEKVQAIKDKVTSIFDNIKSTIQDRVELIKTVVGAAFQIVKDKILTPIENAKEKIREIVDKIKGFFSGLSISLPHIKLPHFSINGSFSLNPPRVPRLSIDWYAKAMQNGMILDRPTIFGASGNSLLAGGEAGREIVVGANSLMGMIQKATTGARPNVNVSVVVNGNVDNYDALAETIGQKLAQQMARQQRAFS